MLINRLYGTPFNPKDHTMTCHKRRPLIGPLMPALIAALMASAGPVASQPTLDPAASQRLDSLQQSPGSAGALVYRGAVWAPKTPSAAPLFHYERRVGNSAAGRSSAHLTYDTEGRVIIAEQAEFSPDYALRRLAVVNQQQGFSGSVLVSVDGRQLDYQLLQNGQTSSASETVSDPVVAGPTLHGFVLQHWVALAGGQTLAVRMIVLTEKTTYGFNIRALPAAEGRSSFLISPNSLLVRWMVAPLTVSFDSASRALLRYEGRVPPMQTVAGALKPLDARVDYTMAVASYQ